MNLWVINQFAASGNYSTGAGERHFYLAQEYLNNDIDTTIFSGSYNHLFHQNPEFKGRGKIDYENRIRFYWVKVPKYKPDSVSGRLSSWFWFTVNLFLINKSQIPKPDVIVVSSMTMFPIIFSLMYRLRHRNVRILFEIRDIWPLTLLEMSNISKYNPIVLLMKYIERLAYKKSDMIISVLPFANKHISQIISNDFRFKWIPNGIIIKPKMNPSLSEGIEHLYPQDKFIITYAGAIGPANALEYFAEAIEGFKDEARIHVNIIGAGPERARLKERLSKLKFVHFVDRIKKEAVHAYLVKSDILYIGWRNKSIYRYGVSANKYNDYMMAAKPILSSSNFPSDPVELAKCGHIVAAESPNAIRDGIEYLFNLSAEERKRLGNNGLKFLKANRQYKVLASHYLTCFKSS